MQFNKPQLRAIHHGPGPCLVLAGPGSGKTTVITSRIRNLIDSYHIPPLHILAVTFSRASADEMKARFETGTQGLESGCPTFGTFHSVFFRIIKSSGLSVRRIISEKQKLDFLCSEIERFSLPYENITDLALDLLTGISRNKSGISGAGSDAACEMLAGSVSPDVFRQICLHYGNYLSSQGFIDFDDMIILCHNLLCSRADILSRCRDTFRYILVDEFQDISPIQYDCLRLLAGSNANIFAVGDDDQSIYGFRGSSPSVMKDFLSDYPSARQILLNVNYRCAPCILRPALTVISSNNDRFEKEIIPCGDSRPSSFDVVGFTTRDAEYSRMVPMIRDYLRCGLSVAVLFRNRADSSLLLSTLSAHNVPFFADWTRPSLFEHFAVKDCLAYIRTGMSLLAGHSEKCRDSLVRVINKPSRYICRESLLDGCFMSMNNFYRTNPHMLAIISRLAADCRMTAVLSPFAAVKYIRNVIGYDSWLASFAADMHEDVGGYTCVLDEFEEFVTGFKTFPELEAAIAAGAGSTESFQSDSINAVRVMTMHHSKGLEFDAVFLPEINDSIMPNKKNLANGGEEEERRLLYVAMTRARRHLFISYVGYLHNKTAHPSRFLKDLLSSS